MKRFAWFVVVSLGLVACSSGQKVPDAETVDKAVETIEKAEEMEPSVEVFAESERRWTGIGVTSKGRVFVNFPRWSDDVPISVAFLENGKPVPFPDASWQSWKEGEKFDKKFVAVQSVVVDEKDNVWVLDTGNPKFQGLVQGAARLFQFDVDGRLLKTHHFVAPVVKPNSYLNDVRFNHETGHAYLTDSGVGGLVVLELATGDPRRVLDGHPSTMAEDIAVVIDGKAWMQNGEPRKVHSDGIAFNKDGYVYYQALTADTLYRIPALDLNNPAIDDEVLASKIEVVAEVGPSDGLLAGPNGEVYLSSLELDAVRAYLPNGEIVVVHEDPRISWPDSFAMGPDGMLWVTASKIHEGPDPEEPFTILKTTPWRPN